MTTPINMNQPSKKIVLDLLNRDNGRSLTLLQVDIGNVTVNPPNFPRNTKAIVTAKPNSGFSGTREIHYNRLDLTVYFSVTTPAIIANYLTNTHEALELINQTYNLQMSEDDIVLEPIAGDRHVFKATPTSLVWLGQVEILITPRTDDTLIDLFEGMTLTTLGGFTAPVYTPNIGWDMGQTTFNEFTNPLP